MAHPLPSPALPIVATANPHYQRFGGEAAVQRLVAAFYRAMDSRPEAATIRAMHADDLADTRRVLEAYLCEWMGGPRRYSATRGAPMLRRRHQPFDIDTAARDAWMACMREALAATCPDAALRGELEAAFLKIADHIRNTDHGTDHGARHGSTPRAHPGRPREATADAAAALPPVPASHPHPHESTP